MSDQAKINAVDDALHEIASVSVSRGDAVFFMQELERRGYQILPFPPNHPYHPDKQRRRDAGESTSDRPSHVTRIGLRGTTSWISIGDYDGYFRAVVESYADDQTEYVASCGHRHMDKTKALLCAARMVRIRERRAEKLATWEQRRAERLGALPPRGG